MLTCNTCGSVRYDDDERCPACGNVAAWYRPSPVEVQVACLRIQRSWTAEVEQQRRATAWRAVEWFVRECVSQSGRVNRKGGRDE